MPACGSESASVGSFLVQSWTSVYGIINSDIVKGFKLQDKAYKDRELSMDFFKNISITGRLCYLFMCIEKYLVSLYPDRDWTIVAERLWIWTEKYWDEAQEESYQIIPEYLMEFDTYEETNSRCFDGKLSRELYEKLIRLYDGITDGKSDDEINQVLFTTVEWGIPIKQHCMN